MKTTLLTKFVFVITLLGVIPAFFSGCGKSAGNRNLESARKSINAHDKASAAKYVSQAIASDPQNPDIHMEVVVIYTRPGFHNEQVQAAKKLVSILDAGGGVPPADQRKLVEMYSAVAMLMDKGNEDALAEHCYEKALQADPSDPMLSNNLAYYYAEKKKNLTQAERLARYAISIRPGEPSIQDTMGWVLYRLRRHTEGEKHLLKCVETMPDNPDLRYHLGAVYVALGKNKQAEIELRKALLLAPRHSDSQILLNMLMLQLKNTTK